MPTTINGTTGVSQVQDGAIQTADLADGAVTPAKTQMGALPSMVRLNTANGYGSTNTCIRRYTTTVTTQGTDITYADSATLGASFTINTAGVYAIANAENVGANGAAGISLNTTQPTVSIGTLTNVAERVAYETIGSANYTGQCAWTGYLPAGSVIRPHTAGSAAGIAANCDFTITRIA